MPAVKDGASIIDVRKRLENTMNDRFNAMDTRFTAIENKIAAIETKITNMQGDIATINAKLDLNPIKSFNAATSCSAILRFPPGIHLTDIIPQKHNIDTLTRPQYRVVLTRLGVAWEAGDSVATLRKRVKDYLYAW
ncbi:hypothetical protein TWF718_002114 [Orbilia javanica]|uniref:Uncharacterized protein n=1 Tax=Orbilia javanica TaxID=47235 RepID=A0AAN8MFI3_9PEZI